MVSRPHQMRVFRPGHVMCTGAITLFSSFGIELLCCISLYSKKQGNKKQSSCGVLRISQVPQQICSAKSDNLVDTTHGKSPPPIDCDPEVVQPMPMPLVPGSHPVRRETKQRIKHLTDPFPPIWSPNCSLSTWLPRVLCVKLTDQLLAFFEDFHWFPSRAYVAVSGPLDEVMELPMTLYRVDNAIDFPFFFS